jgi:hypothetical protein
MNSAPVRFISAAFNAAAVPYRGAARTVPSSSSAPRILSEKQVVRIRIHGLEEGRVRLAAEDKGVDLKRIFGHRLTTKRDSHSFGSRSRALAPGRAETDGPGYGARFSLQSPIKSAERRRRVWDELPTLAGTKS